VNLEHSVTVTRLQEGLPCSTQGIHTSPAKNGNGLMNGNSHGVVAEAGSEPGGLHRCPHLASSYTKLSDGGSGARLGNDGAEEGPGWAKREWLGAICWRGDRLLEKRRRASEELLLMLGLARGQVSLVLHRRGAQWQGSQQGPGAGGRQGGGVLKGECSGECCLSGPLPSLFHRLLAAEGTGARAQAGNHLAGREGCQAGALGAAEVLAAFCSQAPRQSLLEEPSSSSCDQGASKTAAASVEGPAQRYLAYLMAATVGSGISHERLLGFLAANFKCEGRRGDHANGLGDAHSEGNGEGLGTGGRGFPGPRHKQVQCGNRSVCSTSCQCLLCEHHLLPFFGHLKVLVRLASSGCAEGEWQCGGPSHSRVHSLDLLAEASSSGEADLASGRGCGLPPRRLWRHGSD